MHSGFEASAVRQLSQEPARHDAHGGLELPGLAHGVTADDAQRISDVGRSGRSPAIVAAMEEEVAHLRARIVGARAVALSAAHASPWARSGAARVALAVTGDGERNARRGMAALLAAQSASAGSSWSASRAG